MFRTDRISHLGVCTSTFEPRPMPKDALDLVKAGVKRSSREAVVTVEASADDVAAALAFESMEVEALGDHRTRVTLQCEDWHWLLFNLSHLKCAFTIDGPAEWSEEIKRFAAALAGE